MATVYLIINLWFNTAVFFIEHKIMDVSLFREANFIVDKVGMVIQEIVVNIAASFFTFKVLYKMLWAHFWHNPVHIFAM